MNSSVVLSVITFVYGFAAFLYILSWVFKKSSPGRLATWVAFLGLAGNTAGFIMRWVESYRLGIGHAPLSNLYESLVFFAWAIVLIYLILEWKYENRIIGAFTTPIAFLAMAYASLSPYVPSGIEPLLPPLKSNWLIAHVIACFIGYAAFAVAFGISCMYLIKKSKEGEQLSWVNFAKPVILFIIFALFGRVLLIGNWFLAGLAGVAACLTFYAAIFLTRQLPDDTKNRLLALFPATDLLDELNYQLVIFGFLFLSVGIITGAVWANSAWGRYWGWDPKETWSLITWFVYATLLHAKMMRGWQGRRIAFLSVIGFAAVIFTYFGVNLLPGLHSYGALAK